MVEHTQTIRWQTVDELLECFDPFVGLTLKGLKKMLKITYQKILENFIRRLTIIILQDNTQRAETLVLSLDMIIQKERLFQNSRMSEI